MASSRRMKEVSESEGSAGGHWKSKLKRQKSNIEDDLSQSWTERWAMPTWCHMFKESIDSYDDLKKAFFKNYLQQKKCIKDSVEIYNIRQRDGESRMHTEHKLNNEKEQPKVTKKRETFRKDKALAILMVQPWERVARQRITQSFSLNPDLFFPPLGEDEGTEGPMIIEAEIGGHCIHRMYMDGGSASEILYEHCLDDSLLVEIGDEEHSASAWMNFVVVRSPSPYNGIIGRPGVKKLQAVLSTAHRML
ncbi:hypothetical protein Tco_0628989 [Tanacetum coccineum]|uniref:Uncharacterized protein n=1 Tax=Tanacetum coccineum TaxID=301880 RepID=A0ABQ4WRZ2_9ASTR